MNGSKYGWVLRNLKSLKYTKNTNYNLIKFRKKISSPVVSYASTGDDIFKTKLPNNVYDKEINFSNQISRVA